MQVLTPRDALAIMRLLDLLQDKEAIKESFTELQLQMDSLEKVRGEVIEREKALGEKEKEATRIIAERDTVIAALERQQKDAESETERLNKAQAVLNERENVCNELNKKLVQKENELKARENELAKAEEDVNDSARRIKTLEAEAQHDRDQAKAKLEQMKQVAAS